MGMIMWWCSVWEETDLGSMEGGGQGEERWLQKSLWAQGAPQQFFH